MHKQKSRGKGRSAPKRRAATNSKNAMGSANRPPKNSGTIQIPRPMTNRIPTAKRTFKVEYVLTSGTSDGLFFGASLYTPFYTIPTTGGSYVSSVPASLSDMYAAYGLYKPKKVQLIFEPLLLATTIPSPYTVAMVFDAVSPSKGTLSQAQIISYQNATKISPLYPNELGYLIPNISAQNTNQIVLNGGWMDTNEATVVNALGQIVVNQTTPVTFSTPYCILTLVYEIWFKNPI